MILVCLRWQTLQAVENNFFSLSQKSNIFCTFATGMKNMNDMENKKELVVLWLDNHRDPEVWLAKKLASATHRRTLAFLNEKVYPHYSPRSITA